MPPNGHALRLDEVGAIEKSGAASIEITPAATAAPTKPDAGGPIQIDIGRGLASAAAGLCCALCEFWDAGHTASETVAANGARLAVLAVSMINYTGAGDADFIDRARTAARHELRQRFDRCDSDFFQAYSAAEADAALDYYIDSVLDIVVRVVRDERALQTATAN